MGDLYRGERCGRCCLGRRGVEKEMMTKRVRRRLTATAAQARHEGLDGPCTTPCYPRISITNRSS